MRLSPKLLIWHPILFGILPALHLFAGNVDKWPLGMLYRPLVFLAVLSLLLFLGVAGWWRSASRAAPFISLGLIYIFTYERVVSGFGIGNQPVWSRPIGLLYLAVGGIFFVWLGKRLRHARGELLLTNQIMTAMAVMLLITPLYLIPTRAAQDRQDLERLRFAPPALSAEDSSLSPNIYHIVLDGYGRSDILQEIYRHDNNAFISQLKDLGFYVADQSRSNYIQTLLSLASTYNLEYLDKLQGRQNDEGKPDDDRMILNGLLNESAAVEALKRMGYRTYLLPARYPMANLDNFAVQRYDPYSLNEFTFTLFRSTPLTWLAYIWGEAGHLADPDLASHRRQILATFRNVAEPLPSDQPALVLAHLLVPHPPFTFNEEGGVVDKKIALRIEDGSHFHDDNSNKIAEYISGYRNQATYTEREVIKSLRAIIGQSKRPTVIILQGDHGPGSGLNWESTTDSNVNERTAILNAYYFSDGEYEDLTPQTTPVNTYRVIFNHYFGAQLPLLENRFYYTAWSRPFEFVDVTDRLRSSEVAAE